jgi:hypothetical protein
MSVVLLAFEVLLRSVRVGLRLRRRQRAKQDRVVPFGDAYDDPEEGRRMPPLQSPVVEYRLLLRHTRK